MIGSTHYVSTEEELLDWADALTNNTSLNCVLLDDITLTEDWTPVCIDGYAGTFDGRGHKISNLKKSYCPGRMGRGDEYDERCHWKNGLTVPGK